MTTHLLAAAKAYAALATTLIGAVVTALLATAAPGSTSFTVLTVIAAVVTAVTTAITTYSVPNGAKLTAVDPEPRKG